MKKLIATLICIVVLSMTALPVAAQRRARWVNRQVYNQRYDSRYDNNNIYNDDYRYGRERSVWDRHRDKITTAAGAGGGALLGGLIGGKKGALIGAIAGGGGAAIYTYKIRDKYRRY
jgi:outer membrane lipoprotein SlyB